MPIIFSEPEENSRKIRKKGLWNNLNSISRLFLSAFQYRFNKKGASGEGWADGARLITLLLFFVVGLLSVGYIASIDIGKETENYIKGANEAGWQGLSPAVRACYVYGSKSSAIIISFSLGISLGVLYIFGTFLYKKFRESSSIERNVFWSALSETIKDRKDTELREIAAEFREYEKTILDRRNIFWGLYTRVALAILVVSLIALLIGSCKIESQAGLPIISGIIAFIIGQGSELIHAAGTPPLFIRPDSGTAKPQSRPAPSPSENDSTPPRKNEDQSEKRGS